MIRFVAPIALLAGVSHAGPFEPGVSIEDAAARAERDGRPVLAYVTVPGCLACVRMERTTLADESLAEFLAQRTVAIHIDALKNPDAAAPLGVRAYPTIILVDAGEPTTRLVGYRTADEIRAWVDDPGVSDRAVLGVGAPLGEIHDFAMDRLMSGAAEEAARALAEVWVRTPIEPDTPATVRWLRQVRYPSLLTRLTENADARRVIEPLAQAFDASGPMPDAPAELIRGYAELMLILNRTEALDAWLDRMLDLPGGTAALRATERSFDRLVDLDRWADAGTAAADAHWTRWLRRAQGNPTGDPVHDAAPPRSVEFEHDRAPERVAAYIRALRAADRHAEADDLERALNRP